MAIFPGRMVSNFPTGAPPACGRWPIGSVSESKCEFKCEFKWEFKWEFQWEFKWEVTYGAQSAGRKPSGAFGHANGPRSGRRRACNSYVTDSNGPQSGCRHVRNPRVLD